MKTFEFEQTSMSSAFAFNLKDDYSLQWVDHRTPLFYRAFFYAMADVLKFWENKENKKIGFKLLSLKGDFELGAMLNYIDPEEGEDEDKGNWYLEFTFYESDMEGIETIIDSHSQEFIRSMVQETMTHVNGTYRDNEIIHDMTSTAVKTIKEFLDANADETEEVELVLRGIFTASVVYEDGKKVMSLVPGECIKQVIKNDSAI